MTHTCHARNCETSIPRTKLMCRMHWFMVPKRLREMVWREYRAGQCDLQPPPSDEWHKAANAAIASVATQEKERTGETHGKTA